MRGLPASSPNLIARKADIYAGLSVLAQELPLEDLPELAGEAARAQAVACLRYSQSGHRRERGGDPLLTVEQLATRLGISEAQVYRLAKTVLRAAAVDVGEGTLRFDPERIARFIEARRRS